MTPKAVIAGGNTLYEVCDKLVKAQKPAISDVDKKWELLLMSIVPHGEIRVTII